MANICHEKVLTRSPFGPFGQNAQESLAIPEIQIGVIRNALLQIT